MREVHAGIWKLYEANSTFGICVGFSVFYLGQFIIIIIFYYELCISVLA